MKEVMPIEQAEAEVTAWLDKKKITNTRRSNAKTIIENLVEAVQYGTLSISGDGAITHTLAFPVEDGKGQTLLSALVYTRTTTDETVKAYDALRINIPETQLMALVSVLTKQPYGYITKLDSTDLNISKCIAVFFMS